MLRSMTGFGAAQHESTSFSVAAEIKSVNGRFLKVVVKAPPELNGREADLEAMVKKHLRRGSVTLNIRFNRSDPEDLAGIDGEAVGDYEAAVRRLGLDEAQIPMLHGVIGKGEPTDLSAPEWQVVENTVQGAIAAVVEMREREGAALVEILGGACGRIEEATGKIRARAPAVVEEARRRLTERVAVILDGTGVAVDPQIVAREIAVLADKSDITEELDRLLAHVDHVREKLHAEEAGRSLDFLAQELLREANTVGSKSSDIETGRLVVELKSVVEQIKEQVANVE